MPHDPLKGIQMVTRLKKFPNTISISPGFYFGDMRLASTYKVSMGSNDSNNPLPYHNMYFSLAENRA